MAGRRAGRQERHQGNPEEGLRHVFDRPDGLKQQTIDCWPIYTFAGDTKPGDTNGQGVGGTWYVVSPDGKPVGASPEKITSAHG